MQKNSQIFITSSLSHRAPLSNYTLVLIGVIGLLFVAEWVGVAIPLSSVIEKWWQGWAVRTTHIAQSVVSPWRYWQTLSTTQRRVRDLELRYAQVLAQVGEVETLRKENETLRALISSSSAQTRPKLVTVPIISYGRPLIAAGEEQGVVPGMMVLHSQVFLGVVDSVSRSQASVTLLTQENSPTILAVTEKGVKGIVSGDGKRVVLSEVPIEAEVAVGERVVTQGQQGIAPGVLVGTVAQVRSQPSAAVKTVVIEQLVSFYEASLIEVK